MNSVDLLDPLAHRVARRWLAEAADHADPLAARVVARYLAWADGKLVEVEDDEDEFAGFGVQ